VPGGAFLGGAVVDCAVCRRERPRIYDTASGLRTTGLCPTKALVGIADDEQVVWRAAHRPGLDEAGMRQTSRSCASSTTLRVNKAGLGAFGQQVSRGRVCASSGSRTARAAELQPAGHRTLARILGAGFCRTSEASCPSRRHGRCHQIVIASGVRGSHWPSATSCHSNLAGRSSHQAGWCRRHPWARLQHESHSSKHPEPAGPPMVLRKSSSTQRIEDESPRCAAAARVLARFGEVAADVGGEVRVKGW